MKKSLFITICLLLTSVISGYSQSPKTLNYFEGKDISGLIVDGAFDVQLSQGNKTGVTITIREDAISKLSVSMTEDNHVRISFGDDITKYFIDKKKPLAKIVVSKLDYLNLSGNVSVIAKGQFTAGSKFSLLMTGASFVSFIKLSTDNVYLDLKGKCKLEDSEFTGKYSVEMNATESASGSIKVTTKDFFATGSMASNITATGEATNKIKIVTSGTSKASILGCNSPLIDAFVSDMSRVNATVNGTANLTKSKMASFRYAGNGKINGEGAKPL